MKKIRSRNYKDNFVKNMNNRVFCRNTPGTAGFDVFLDFSGRHIMLSHQRHNAMLYALLKDGISLSALYRWSVDDLSSVKKFLKKDIHDRQISRIKNSVRQLVKAVDTYFNEELFFDDISSDVKPKTPRKKQFKELHEYMLAA